MTLKNLLLFFQYGQGAEILARLQEGLRERLKGKVKDNEKRGENG